MWNEIAWEKHCSLYDRSAGNASSSAHNWSMYSMRNAVVFLNERTAETRSILDDGKRSEYFRIAFSHSVESIESAAQRGIIYDDPKLRAIDNAAKMAKTLTEFRALVRETTCRK